MADFILINTDTAEVEFFSDKEQAENFIAENELDNYIIMPCIEVTDKEEVELVICPNEDRDSVFGSVAEYQENVFNSDFIKYPNAPVRYMQAYKYYN